MKLTRALIFLTCLALIASASAQDSLLGKKKGSSPPPAPPKQSSGSGQNSSGSNSSPRSRNSGGSNDSNASSSNDSSYQSSSNSNQDSNLLGRNQNKRVQSRSGKVHYGTVNNLINKETIRTPISIQRAPTRNELPMRDQIRREDRPHAHFNDGRFRVGYYQYSTNWRDDAFTYPYYVFDPYAVDQCVVSPWYYYSFLPAYVDTSRLVIVSNYENSFVGLPFDYQAPSRYRDDQFGDDRDSLYDGSYMSPRGLTYAIDDIVSAFTRGDRRAVDRLVPRYGAISLATDGTSYGVKADDFYDMLMDAITADTIDYQIIGVKSSQDEAEVLAVHYFVDSWNTRQAVYHRFHLFSERGHVVIRSFETSADPFW